MKKISVSLLTILLFACNSSRKDKPAGDNPQPPVTNETSTTTTTASRPAAGSASVSFSVEGVNVTNYASVLVTKDKDKLQPGAPYICMITSNAAANNNEYLTLNFLMDTKPGTYPVAGSSFQRGKDPNNEMYGGLLGGKPKLTEYKVTITECKDLGSNNMGGHKWSISGTCEEVLIKATRIMLMDKTKKHPEEIKLQKISFANLSFDDNWEEMMEKAMDQMKKKD